ncbi:hypothetical protein L3081_24485 [Colwellia sp. MSW7]|uniref:DUF4935 domain-containing protein n=1 Tax=Colwellia maritima TaxID=2912588 RepID=A0ABS9X6Y0_9GAMM|nr:hypothetical protein [Colwellia maritima]MCI2285988.1 hypothetical protein [Colwellia maritima]
MHIYLDQNIWIDLAKIHHGKDTSDSSVILLERLNDKVRTGDIVFPLSNAHYIETSTISNEGRRNRLGEVMFKYSKGVTLASYKSIVINEIERALKSNFPIIKPRYFQLFGKGVQHAYGEKLNVDIPEFMERAILTGEQVGGKKIGGFHKTEHNEDFKDHLTKVSKMCSTVPKGQWQDTLDAMALADIEEPLSEVLEYWEIEFELFMALGKERISQILNFMPSRALEIHLNKQVLKNPNYNPTSNDLMDWGGVALASQYCDIIIGEKHIYNMLLRDKFKTKAKLHRRLSDLEQYLC